MDNVLVLKTVEADMTSFNGFKWPKRGCVKAPDWNPKPVCGGGLHGALWGEGEGELFLWAPNIRWLVVQVPADSIVDLGGKVKFPRGKVVFCGGQKEATDYLQAHGGTGRAIIGGTVTGGNQATVVGGYRAIVTGGYGATVIGGDRAAVTGGCGATVIGGKWATVIGGDGAVLQLSRWNGRKRIVTAYVGEDGIQPETLYKLDEAGKFVEA